MTLKAALLELRGRTKVLQVRLKVLAESAQRAGGGTVHHLVEQVDKSAVDALGWVQAARKAIRHATRRGATRSDVRHALTEAQAAWTQLRRKEPRRLRGRILTDDLADLCRRGEKAREAGLRGIGEWAKEAIPLVQAASAALRSADEAMSDCWRELASDDTDRRVIVQTTIVG
jgi:hypothetical protein